MVIYHIDMVILDIDMGYELMIREMTISIWSSSISLWDILSLCAPSSHSRPNHVSTSVSTWPLNIRPLNMAISPRFAGGQGGSLVPLLHVDTSVCLSLFLRDYLMTKCVKVLRAKQSKAKHVPITGSERFCSEPVIGSCFASLTFSLNTLTPFVIHSAQCDMCRD